MRSGSAGFDVFRSTSDLLDASRRVTLAAVANAGDNLAVDQLRAATDDLDARQTSLRAQLAGAKRALDDLRAQQQTLQRSLDEARQAEQGLRAPTGDRVCPVQGGASFTDSFDAPRGNGRTHKGIDMFAPSGTPLVAVVSGSVFFQSDTLGGLAAYVQGNDGNTYYDAHLSDYVGGARSVTAGELIGHLGNTGDASDAPPQLHFEIRPGGPNGIAIDPYPTVRAHC